MMKQLEAKIDWRWIVGIILVLAASRLIPHPPNFTPVGTMAILAGLFIKDLRLGLAILCTSMLLSDLLLGLHSSMFFVYGALAAIAIINRYAVKITLLNLITSAFGSALLFFLVTNFGAWITHNIYPHTFEGLAQAYAAGLPFFKNTLFSNLFFINLSVAILNYGANRRLLKVKI